MRNRRLAFLCLTPLLMAAMPLLAQTPLPLPQFNASQRAEWARFREYWHGNGKGTCMPMMEAVIRAGGCTRFDFTAHVSIGASGRIQKAEAVRNNIVCQRESVRRELMRCFMQSLREDHGLWDGADGGGFVALRGRVVRAAPIE
jgi:hypothetical protein